MKTTAITAALIATLGFSTPSGAAGGAANKAFATAWLSDDEAATLMFMREEEKLARDVYQTLYSQWSARIFRNIARSEQKHMDMMEAKIDCYGLTDPVQDESAVGEFANLELQTLYWSLLEKGQGSLLEALYVGALIEELDMQDLRAAIEDTDQPDLVRSYQQLLNGSVNHLQAFVRQIESLGVEYQAQYLTQQQVDELLGF